VVSQIDQDEILLVLLAQQGDVAAFEELLRRLHGPLRQYVNRMVGPSDADDVMQDSAIRLYRNIRYLREPVVFRAWAFRIATRIALTYLKRAERWRQLENDPDLIRAIASARLQSTNNSTAIIWSGSIAYRRRAGRRCCCTTNNIFPWKRPRRFLTFLLEQ
jgi:DNA-directed RNA polymerase specialized sigma24 family protein